MRKIKKFKTEIIESIIESITCNKCGEVCDTPRYGWPGVHVEFEGGYTSTVIGDGCGVSFDLCEKCMAEMFKTFKHPPDRSMAGWLGGGIVDDDGNPVDDFEENQEESGDSGG